MEKENKKLYGYAILIDQVILQKRAKEEGLDLLIERAKESAEIAIRAGVEGIPAREENA